MVDMYLRDGVCVEQIHSEELTKWCRKSGQGGKPGVGNASSETRRSGQ